MYHKLILVGNLGRDPELRYSSNGIPVTNLSVATNHKRMDPEGEMHEETIWFRVAVYGKQAESCNEYLTKGQKVLVEGALVADDKGGPRVYSRKDGTYGSSFDVRATTVRFLSSKGEGGISLHAGGGEVETEMPTEETLPF